MHDQEEIQMLGLIGEILKLDCPFQLGLASDIIVPYHHVWLNDPRSGEQIPNSEGLETFDMNVTQDSNDRYYCAIKMRRCSDIIGCSERIIPVGIERATFRITKAGECLRLICVYAPHTLCHLVQSLFPW